MVYNFACADFTFPLLSHDTALDLIRLLDFNWVDIGFFQDRSRVQPADVFSNIAAESKKLQKSLHRKDLRSADLFLQTATDFESTAINHPDEKVRTRVRDSFLKTLEVASIINAPHVTILPGVVFQQVGRDDSVKRAYEELDWRVEKAKRADIVFGVEAHIGSFCDSPQAAMEMVESVDGLTLTLDYTHFTKLGYEDKEVEVLFPYASHFHARCANKERAQVTFKKNTIDYSRVAQRMVETNYSGCIGIEYVWIEWEGLNEVDNVSETVLLRDFLHKELLKYT
jgi:sugar phosphate isomerase/epimerase